MWGVLVVTVAFLLIGLATPNVIYAHRIQRIVDQGGYVRSRASYFGEDASAKLGHRFYSFYRDHYFIRDDYDVFLGDIDRAVEPCGAGITLAESSEDEVHKDPGDDGPKMAQALGRVGRLSLAETAVTDQGLAPLAGMTSLSLLDLSSTRVKGPGLAYLQGIDIRHLSLHSNSIDDAGFASLPNFPNLEQLDIGKTRVGNAVLARLPSYSKLKDLNLEGLPVTDDLVQKLTKLSLWRLDLSNTPITDASLPHLEKMTSLFDLNLCGTKITLEKAMVSENSAIRRWVSIRKLIFAPGECEAN